MYDCPNVRFGSLADPQDSSILMAAFGGKADIGDRILQTFKLMSAFPKSGRSDGRNQGNLKVRFRPEAVAAGGKCSELLSGIGVR